MQVRREEILTATIAAIKEHGIESLRIAEVAARLDISSALVIYHFQTKENLLVETFRHAADGDLLKLRRIVRGPTPVTERLRETLLWYAPSGRSRGWELWIDGWAAALRDGELAAVISELDQQWSEALADLIREGIESRDLVPSRFADPAELAAWITALLDGLTIKTLVYGAGPRRAVIGEWVERLMATELGAPPTP